MEDLQETIQGCIQNNRSSQEKLYRQVYLPLFCMCRRFFRNEHEAIESVNDGMLKVFGNIASYSPKKGKFYNWVYTIVRNTALDKFRMSCPDYLQQDPFELAYSVADPQNTGNPIRALEERDLYVLLDTLNPSTRVVCNLFYIEGLSIKEIAEQLQISAGTVKWHLSESRKKLRSIFEKHLNDQT